MDIRKVKKLIELMEDSDLLEIEIREGDESVRIARGSRAQPPAPLPPRGAEPPAAEVPPASARAPSGHVVKAPMVGTFYRAPSPNSPPFVNVGDRVVVGQVLCIVEAMKLMNEIEAEVAG